MQNRISRHELYMGVAELFAQRSECDRLHVGVVAVRDGRIVCVGYNSPLPHASKCKDSCEVHKSCINSVHAEANLICYAAKTGISLKGTTIYCTHSPCSYCSKLLIQAGVRNVIFKEWFENSMYVPHANITYTKWQDIIGS